MLSLHLGKTECMLFGPPRKLAKVTDFHIRCYDTVIKSTEVVKYLGVQIDRYLKFDHVVNSIVNKVNARLKGTMRPFAGNWHPVWSKKKDCRFKLIWYLYILDKVSNLSILCISGLGTRSVHPI